MGCGARLGPDEVNEVQITGMLWGAKLLNYVGYPTSEVRGPDATGEEIYGALCTRCHGNDLSGGVGPALGAGSELVDRPDAYVIQTITVGLGRMPAFRNTLSEEQIVSVAEYLREQQASG